MGICAVCHNEYDKTFDVIMDGRRFTFDCLECAIEEIAPRCAHCGCKIIGHGVESAGEYFCCAHCAHRKGIPEARDRIDVTTV